MRVQFTPARTAMIGTAILMACACGAGANSAKLLKMRGIDVTSKVTHSFILSVGAVLIVRGRCSCRRGCDHAAEHNKRCVSTVARTIHRWGNSLSHVRRHSRLRILDRISDSVTSAIGQGARVYGNGAGNGLQLLHGDRRNRRTRRDGGRQSGAVSWFQLLRRHHCSGDRSAYASRLPPHSVAGCRRSRQPLRQHRVVDPWQLDGRRCKSSLYSRLSDVFNRRCSNLESVGRSV
jgi:hypothetical protein